MRLDRQTKIALQTRSQIDLDFRVLEHDGTVRYMASRGRVYYDEKGRAYRMAGLSMDITASQQNEAEFSRVKEAAEADNAKDNFLAILSHELHTPLTQSSRRSPCSRKTRRFPRPFATRSR